MVTVAEIVAYAEIFGAEAAKNLLLMYGPDSFAGDYEDYERAHALLTLYSAAE